MSQLRSRSNRPLAMLAILAALAACFGTNTEAGAPSVTISNVTSATCTHSSATSVTCTIDLDVQLHSASIFDTLVTIATNDTLSQQWLLSAIGEGLTFSFPKSKLTRTDTGCLRPQTTVSIYDGPTAQYPLIASATVTAISLTCS